MQGHSRARLYFLHIPKTAGSSVTEWLRRRVAPALWCPAKDWTQLVQHRRTDLWRYRLFCGHFGWGLDETVGRALSTVTVFRDPFDRTLSHYRHVHRDPAHPRHHVVSAQTFAEFVADQDNWPMIENFQARYMMRNVVDTRQLFGRLDSDRSKLNRLATTTEDGRYLFDQDHVREVAHGHFNRLAAVGTTEDLDGFLRRVSRCRGLGWEPGGDIGSCAPQVNVAPAGEDMSDVMTGQTRDTIHRLTRIDQELHERARRG